MSSIGNFQIPEHDPNRLPYPLGEDFARSLTHRLDRARGRQTEIRKLFPEFTFRVEHHALCLITHPDYFKENGALSILLSPSILKRLLERVSPFAKHYMLHSSPFKGEEFQNAWGHASYRAPIERPELTDEYIREADVEQIRQSKYYEQRFRTLPGLVSLSTHNDVEDNECRHRDENRCQISLWEEGTTEPYIFCFIPPGWNDTVDNNNATGNLLPSGRILTSVNLLGDIISPYKLGKTHKAWNMICVHADLFQALSRGLCALKYEDTKPHEDGNPNEFNVVCRFYWMPQLTPRFNKAASGAAEVNALLEEFNHFFKGQCPPPPMYPSKSPAQPHSGTVIKLKREKADVEKTKSAIKVHWGCILYTALCGGAGRAQFLTGMDQSDGSLNPRDKEFMAANAMLEKGDKVSETTGRNPSGSGYGTETTGRSTESEADFARGA